MKEQFYRTSLLLGEDGVEALNRSRVILFGVGGVGSFCAEALVRSGIGRITLVDMDLIDRTNLNRQLHTLESNIGLGKAEEMAGRLLQINADLDVQVIREFYLPENRHLFLPGPGYDYIIDAIDTVSAKIDLAEYGFRHGIPVISAMGAGNKLDPTAFRVGDLFETKVDPIARVMRRELRKRGVDRLRVVYSLEEPIRIEAKGPGKLIGSVAFGPSVAGLIMAGEVIKDLAIRERL